MCLTDPVTPRRRRPISTCSLLAINTSFIIYLPTKISTRKCKYFYISDCTLHYIFIKYCWKDICTAFVDPQASLISCSLLLDVISFIETHPSRRLLFPSKTMYKLNADKQPAILHIKVSMPGVICVYWWDLQFGFGPNLHQSQYNTQHHCEKAEGWMLFTLWVPFTLHNPH